MCGPVSFTTLAKGENVFALYTKWKACTSIHGGGGERASFQEDNAGEEGGGLV